MAHVGLFDEKISEESPFSLPNSYADKKKRPIVPITPSASRKLLESLEDHGGAFRILSSSFKSVGSERSSRVQPELVEPNNNVASEPEPIENNQQDPSIRSPEEVFNLSEREPQQPEKRSAVCGMDKMTYKGYLRHRQGDQTKLTVLFTTLVLIYIISLSITRDDWGSLPSWNALWWTSFPLRLIAIIAISVRTTGLVGQFYTLKNMNFPFPKVLAVAENFMNFASCMAVLFGSLVKSFDLLARVYEGVCFSDHFSIWETQSCNPLASSNSIPMDTVIFIYAIPTMAMCFLPCCRFEAVVASHVIGLVAVSCALAMVGGYLEVYAVLYGLLFFACSCFGELQCRERYFNIIAEKQLEEVQLDSRELRLKEENQSHKVEMQLMMGTVAHELKAPAEHLREELKTLKEVAQDNPEVLAIVARVESTANFFVMAINRSEDVAKTRNDVALEPKETSFCLRKVVVEAYEDIERISASHVMKLHPLPEAPWSFLMTDRQWLAENVTYMLSNAVKFSPDDACIDMKVSIVMHRGPITDPINSRLIPAPRKGVDAFNAIFSFAIDHPTLSRSVLVEVADTGYGVSEEDKLCLFKQFQRGGLGLLSLAGRVDALGGTYGARDRDDSEKGSVFWFAFPYKPDLVLACEAMDEVEPRSPSDDRMVLREGLDPYAVSLRSLLNTTGTSPFVRSRNPSFAQLDEEEAMGEGSRAASTTGRIKAV